MVAKDLNGDHAIDLAVSDAGDGSLSVLMNRGDGTFDLAGNYAVGATPWSIAAGDLNGDGRADLAVANVQGPNAAVLFNACLR